MQGDVATAGAGEVPPIGAKPARFQPGARKSVAAQSPLRAWIFVKGTQLPLVAVIDALRGSAPVRARFRPFRQLTQHARCIEPLSLGPGGVVSCRARGADPVRGPTLIHYVLKRDRRHFSGG